MNTSAAREVQYDMEWALMALHRGLFQLRCSTLYSEDAMQIRISPQLLSATIIAFS
jgi:hypothetical protein